MMATQAWCTGRTLVLSTLGRPCPRGRSGNHIQERGAAYCTRWVREQFGLRFRFQDKNLNGTAAVTHLGKGRPQNDLACSCRITCDA